jgi:DMSO/TMAO reductase YedYZ heme-binding membrane subunit
METVVWEFIRASGLTGYIALTVSVVLGLSVSTRATDPISKRAHINEVHQTTSVLACVLIGLHVVLLLFHDYVDFDLAGLLVPFASDWRPVAMAAGIISMYLLLVLLLTSVLRARVGYRSWRALHFAAYPAWALATVHGVFGGSDTGNVAIEYMYLLSLGAVILLVVFGALSPQRPVQRPGQTDQPGSQAATARGPR